MYDGLTKVFDYALAKEMFFAALFVACRLYTSDAADDGESVDLG
ncbi:Gp23 family protein, partial [Listeria monocytogenes]